MCIKNWFSEMFGCKQAEEKPVIRFPAGTKITCPKCSREIAVAMRDIIKGESARSDAWRSDIDLTYGRMVCPDDDTEYIVHIAGGGLSLHTSEGWM